MEERTIDTKKWTKKGGQNRLRRVIGDIQIATHPRMLRLDVRDVDFTDERLTPASGFRGLRRATVLLQRELHECKHVPAKNYAAAVSEEKRRRRVR
jgi:hypothetical protein